MFGFRGKLSPRYVGPYPIIGRVGPVAYRVQLPANMAGVHNVFHISMLRRGAADPFVAVQPQELEISDETTYVVRLQAILDRDVKTTRRSTIPLVKVRWSENLRGVTWKLESKMRDKYPELFIEA